MAEIVSKWEKSEMDVEKMTALIVVQKIPRHALVKWTNAEGQHWPSDLDLYRYYYGISKHSRIADSYGLKLHNGKSREYIQIFTQSSWLGWKKKWIYWTVSRDDSLFFTGRPAEKSSSWDSTPSDLNRITPYILAIKDLREGRLTN